MAGAFSAFFGAAPVGALLAAEFINQKATTLSRTTMVAGLASGAMAWSWVDLIDPTEAELREHLPPDWATTCSSPSDRTTISTVPDSTT